MIPFDDLEKSVLEVLDTGTRVPVLDFSDILLAYIFFLFSFWFL